MRQRRFVSPEGQERMARVSFFIEGIKLMKIVEADHPSIGFELLFNTGLLDVIFPEMAALQGVERKNGQGHKDNFYHTLEVLENLSHHTHNAWLRWAAIMHDIAKPLTKRYDPKTGWTFHGHDEIGARMLKPLCHRLRLPTL